MKRQNEETPVESSPPPPSDRPLTAEPPPPPPPRASAWVPALLCATLAGLALVYRAELRAWFFGDTVAHERGGASSSSPEEHVHEDDGPDAVAHYTCPMHPSVQASEAGSCPICGMDLVPVTRGELDSNQLRVDAMRTQVIGVRSEAAEIRSLSHELRATGEVVVDENRVRGVSLRAAGWIEKLYVEEVGQEVRRGQPLMQVYSPEIFAASEEVLAAQNATGPARERLLSAAKKRLALLGVSEGQRSALLERGETKQRIGIASPVSGYVLERNVVEGDRIEPGTSMFKIADLSQLWIEARIYEGDAPWIHEGVPVHVELSHRPDLSFDAQVAYVYPQIDRETRTLRARIVVENPKLELRPGMFAELRFRADMGEALTIPREAVIYTGPRRIVFVDLGEGRLEPREVTLGPSSGDYVAVRSGLEAGEQVVSSGNFLIAAESRIRSAASLWSPPSSQELGAQSEGDDASVAAGSGEPPAAGAYSCPMHPEVHSDGPGQCPICHMKLVASPAAMDDEVKDAPISPPESTSASSTKSKSTSTAKSTSKSTSKSQPEADQASPEPPAASGPAPAAPDYTCPMHPEVHSNEPGRCPVCKMHLVEAKTKTKAGQP